MTIAIIGAGIAGLAAARTLADAGAEVRVFEKSRGLGGRLATRRGDWGRIDHGAQYASVRDPDFAAYADHAIAKGAAAEWDVGGSDTRRVVGLPGMSGFVTPLAEGLDIARQARATSLSRDGDGVRLDFEDGEPVRASAVVCAVPAPQGTDLLGGLGAPFDRIAKAVIAPCWSLLLVFAGTPRLADAKRFDGSGTLGWLAHDSAKPGREGGERWIVHASPRWSRDHLEEPADAVAERLMAALAEEAGHALPETLYRAAHRWRYSQVETPLDVPFLASADGRIGYCGDACLGGRVEAAYLSGRKMGAHMVERS